MAAHERHGWSREIFKNLLPLAILLAAIAGFAGLLSQRGDPPQRTIQKTVPTADVLPLEPFQGGFRFEVDGLVVPAREISLPAEIEGRIAYKAADCEAGRYVPAGDPQDPDTVLLQIDDRDYQLAVDRLQRQLRRAEVAVEELDEEISGTEALVALSQQELALASRELQRQRRLTNVLTESQRDQAERDELLARNNLVKLQNQLSLLRTRRGNLLAQQQITEAELEQARLDLSRTRIVSPIAGVVVTDPVEQDEYVQKGTTLLTVEDTSLAEVRCSLRMDQIYWLWQSERPDTAVDPRQKYELADVPAEVVYHLAGQRFVWQGRLSRYDGIGVDERTRTIPCRVVVDDPQQCAVVGGQDDGLTAGPPALLRGMYVTVRILAEPTAQLFAVPEEAIRPGKVVYAVRENRLRIVPVRFITLLAAERGPQGDLAEGAVELTAVGHATTETDAPPADVAAWGRSRALIYAPPDQLGPQDRIIVSPLPDVQDGMDLSDWKLQ